MAYQAVEDFGLPLELKKTLHANRNELPSLLGVRRESRSKVLPANASREHIGSYYAISDFSFSTHIKIQLFAGTYESPKVLQDMTVKELEKMYDGGARVKHPNWEQLSMIIIEYMYRETGDVVEPVKVVETKDETIKDLF